MINKFEVLTINVTNMLKKKKRLMLLIFLNKFFIPNNSKQIRPVIKDNNSIESLKDEEKIKK